MNKERIRILYAIPNFDTAGSGKVVYDLAKNLDIETFEVHIACTKDTGAFFQEIKKLGIPIHILPLYVPYRPYITLIKRVQPIVRFLKQNKIDILHSWNWSSDWTELLACKLAGVKYIYTKKAMTWGNRHWKIKSHFSDYIVIINERMRSYFPRKKNQELIPIGIDTALYSKKDEVENDVFQIITVANLVPVKGIEVLIEAVSLLKKQNVKIKLTVLGDNKNEYGQGLRAYSKELNLESTVDFIDKKLDVVPFLAQSDLFVMPTLSRGEGLGVALIEAMAMELLVLGSNVAGIQYILKDFPELMFPAGDSSTLAVKIQEIMKMDKDSKQRLTRALRTSVVEKFELDKTIKAHETLYKKIVKR